MATPGEVHIVEVGPRDGLQNQSQILTVKQRVTLIDKLKKTGLRQIEIGSFVSPTRIPQMTNTDEVFSGLQADSYMRYLVLVPNQKGLQDAINAGVRDIAVFTGASDTFTNKNINCSVSESLETIANIIPIAKQNNINVRGYVSCVLGCPYEGIIPIENVVNVASSLYQLGCYEISLGDTIGVGTPTKARELIKAVSQVVPVSALAAHFHNTYGQGLANLYAVLQEGISVIDAAIGGLGGCPYAKGASGNVATEDVIYMLKGMGISTSVGLDALVDVNQYLCEDLGFINHSKVSSAINNKSTKYLT